MARIYTVISLLLLTLCAKAQDLEYAMELGVMAGPSFYMGDANLNALYTNTTMAAGLMGRYNINPRMALKFDIAYGKVALELHKQVALCELTSHELIDGHPRRCRSSFSDGTVVECDFDAETFSITYPDGTVVKGS